MTREHMKKSTRALGPHDTTPNGFGKFSFVFSDNVKDWYKSKSENQKKYTNDFEARKTKGTNEKSKGRAANI